jgi:nicotinamide riboside kinase
MASNVILVTGPSGSGKTRLIEKLAMEVPMSSAVLYVCHRFMQEFGTTPPLASSLAARIAPGGYASVFDFGSGMSELFASEASLVQCIDFKPRTTARLKLSTMR